jgi:hypothetical protein
MNITSRKVMAYIINTVLIIACFIFLKISGFMLTDDLIKYLVFSQVVLNTGSLLVTNFMDKRLWIKHNISYGKEIMNKDKEEL